MYELAVSTWWTQSSAAVRKALRLNPFPPGQTATGFAVAILAAGLAMVALRPAHSAEKLLGDANCDVRVNSLDAAFVLQLEAGYLWPERYWAPGDQAPVLPCPFNADVRGGGDISPVDAALILQYSAGLVTSLHQSITPTPLPPPLQADTALLANVEEARRADNALFTYCPFGERGAEIFDQLDGVNDFWVPVFCSPGPSTLGEQHLVIYDRQGNELVPLLTLTDTFVGFCADAFCYPSDPDPAARDINDDGRKDLAVSQSTGGNCWECTRLRIFNVANHQANDVPMELPATGLLGGDYNDDGTSAVPRELRDLNGDGQMEIIASDTSWELHGFCHACSPGAAFVLAWDGMRYVNASSDYQQYFDKVIEDLESRLALATRESERVSLAISIALAYGHSGRADEAWARFAEITSTVTSECWTALVPDVETSLQLSVPPDGAQPTTSVHGTLFVPAECDLV